MRKKREFREILETRQESEKLELRPRVGEIGITGKRRRKT